MVMNRIRVAWYWCASCGGCEESFIDLAERLLSILEMVEIVFCPVAIDYKKSDLEELPDGSIDISFINGGIRLEEHLEMVKLLRRKSRIIVAYGACSYMGGVPGLANLYDVDEILSLKYLEEPTVVNRERILPRERTVVEVNGAKVELRLPRLLDRVYPLNQVIDVEYYIPGCPPTPEVFWNALNKLLGGRAPPRGSVLGAESRSLCDTCPLNESKPDKILLRDLKRIVDSMPDGDRCLLAQGYLCLGPVTRGGCGAKCINVLMPCTGCFGPLDDITDYGGKAVSYIASIIDYDDAEDMERVYDRIRDWIGIVYKYSLPASRLRGRIGRRREVRE